MVKRIMKNLFKSIRLLDIILILGLISMFHVWHETSLDLNAVMGDFTRNSIEIRENQELILFALQDNDNNIKKINKDFNNVNEQVSYIDKLLTKNAKKFGIDPKLLHAVAQTESHKNQNARNGSAVGVLQIKPSTGRAMGVSNVYTAEGNVEAGAKYLAYLKKKYKGNEDLMLAGYNAGEGAVARCGNRVPSYTKKYIQKVKSEKKKLTNK